MLKLKYHSWDDTPIKVYKEIIEVCSDTTLSDGEMEIAVMAILCDVDEDVVWNTGINDVVALRPAIQFITEIKPSGNKVSKLNIGGYSCTIDYNVNNMTVSQYVDFQSYWQHNDDPSYLARILSVFIIPNGHKYAEGYDINDLIRVLEEQLPFQIATDLCFFFLRVLASSISLSQTFLGWMMRWMKWTSRRKIDKSQMESMEKLVSQTHQLLGFISLKK